MQHCPGCGDGLHRALVICDECGEVLPLRVVIVSEGSRGGGYAVVVDEQAQQGAQEGVNGECASDG